MSWRRVLLTLTALEPFEACVLIIGVPCAIAICAAVLVRRFIGREQLARSNELAAIHFGVVALAYVMILTFALLSVWEKFSDAQSAVTEEAAAASAIYNIAGDGTQESRAVQDAVTTYLAAAINQEWPAMGSEQADPATAEALKSLYAAASALDRVGSATTQLAAEIFKHIDTINDARQTRITLSAGIVPDLVWFILILGACITILFMLLLTGPDLGPQLIVTTMTTTMLLMALLVIISFDHPFTGAVHVSPMPLQIALDQSH